MNIHFEKVNALSLTRTGQIKDMKHSMQPDKEEQKNLAVNCPCGTGRQYKACCREYLTKEKIPNTPEALMRSRYTAYALHDAAYLQATWDVTKRPEKIDFSREKIDWLRLEITDTKKGGIKDNKGVVSFKAFYRQDCE